MIKFLRLLFFPFAILYFIATEFRNFLFQSRIMRGARFDRPVVCIGNLSTGGTGKTPTTEYVIRLLLSNEIKPATLSRGYGRKVPGFRIVHPDSKTDECGDEPLQIKQKFPDIPVAVCEKRIEGIIQLVKEHPETKAILLDDAYQHRAVKPSLVLLTTSFFQPFFSDFILPVGDLREMRRNASRADVIVVTNCPDWITNVEIAFYRQSIARYNLKAEVFFSKIVYGDIQPVFGKGKPISLTHHVLLITGIAHPDSIVNYVGEKSTLTHLRFSDHHRYGEKDIQKIVNLFNSFANGDKIILTTEKDAKRLQSMNEEILQPLSKLPVYFIEMKAAIFTEKEKFDQLIISHVRTFE